MVDNKFSVGDCIVLIDVSNYYILSTESSKIIEVMSFEKDKHLIPVEKITRIIAGMPNYFHIDTKDGSVIRIPYSEQNGKILRKFNLITC